MFLDCMRKTGAPAGNLARRHATSRTSTQKAPRPGWHVHSTVPSYYPFIRWRISGLWEESHTGSVSTPKILRMCCRSLMFDCLDRGEGHFGVVVLMGLGVNVWMINRHQSTNFCFKVMNGVFGGVWGSFETRCVEVLRGSNAGDGFDQC